MNIFVLLYNSGTDKEGIHSIELKGRTIVLMFEDKDDATRYCNLLEAQDFPQPTVEMINKEEVTEFCTKLDYECRLVEKNFIPQTAEDRLLISPPHKNLNAEDWESETTNKEKTFSKCPYCGAINSGNGISCDYCNFDINTIKQNLEKLL